MRIFDFRSLLASIATIAIAATFGTSCSSTKPAEVEAPLPAPPAWNADCDPIVPSHCGFPFPSNNALIDDPSTKTGKRVAFKVGALPLHNQKNTDPVAWADADGFSPGQTIMTFLPDATIAGLPTQNDLDRSLSKDSPTVLLDAVTGERIPHFSELDMSTTHDDQRSFMIRPVVRLKDATRYIVAIRHVLGSNGKPVPTAPAFAALRDGKPFNHPTIEPRRALYADIFAKLEAAGIARGDLQLAWDYSTASRESNTRWMVHMRDDALAKVGADGPPYVIDKVEENPNPFIRRRISGRMTVPLYLDRATTTGRLVFGDDKLPKQNGTAEYTFLVHIPNSATKTPGALLQNGHGLLGAKTEGQDGYLAEIADKKNMVAFAVDWVGMANADVETVTDSIVSDIGTFKLVVDRQHQGMINALLAMRMMKGAFVRDPQVQFDGKSAIDPTHCYYRGDSQGGIFGTTYMALTTDVTRGLVGEPGAPYSLLLNRSVDFKPFFFLLGLPYNDHLDLQIILGLSQMLWDRTEPDGYLPYITQDMLPGTPAHQILIHAALGDHQVTPLGAHVIARAVKAKNVSPNPRKIWGVAEAAAPFEGSAIVEFDFGNPEVPTTNIPPSLGEDPHDKVRILPAAYNQADTFFREGVIKQYCDGKCDPQ